MFLSSFFIEKNIIKEKWKQVPSVGTKKIAVKIKMMEWYKNSWGQLLSVEKLSVYSGFKRGLYFCLYTKNETILVLSNINKNYYWYYVLFSSYKRKFAEQITISVFLFSLLYSVEAY